MNIDQWFRLFSLVISLLQVIVWPLVVMAILFFLRVPLKSFIENIIEVTLKAGPLETVARREQAIEVAASLGAAAAEIQVLPEEDADRASSSLPAVRQGGEKIQEVTKLVNQLLTPRATRILEGKQVLWVDDVPSNNTYPRNALEALGLRFTISTSTTDALKQLREQAFDLVISDMGRPPDFRAGYTLLEKMRAQGFNTPYIIYAAGANKPSHKAESLERGVFASVSGPTSLFEAVIQVFVKGDKVSSSAD